jgi:hypothetical protein
MARSEQPFDTGLTAAEREALHLLGLGLEHADRGFGSLVTAHHQFGRAMDRFDAAREQLRAAGHDELAAHLRDAILPAGAVGDRWTYELVDDCRDGFLAEIVAAEAAIREALADGKRHVAEQRQQRDWRARAESEAWREPSRE